ncbi:Uncharacterized protein FKW44_020888 [Caligus rogercresseyi]|uniref:Uncharacterized protein n=1 Tax=Caligus rogercresseyi TaxID=217165 RepID=A0A7T8JUR5_CALRO|nr:Uncharacterized protein FKW44_020888 [Caligus rogercresseyi]
MEEEKRHTIVRFLPCRGRSPKEVIEFSTTPSRPPTTNGRLGTLSKRMMLILGHQDRRVNEDGNKSYAKLAAEMGSSKQPWMDLVANGRPYVFELDSAPAQKTSPTTGARTCAPPAPLTATPRLFFLGHVENKINEHAHNTLDSLRAAILEEFANMKKDVVAKACGRFRHHLEMVVAADGGYIEK